MTRTVSEALRQTSRRLAEAGSEAPRLEARVLVETTLGRSRVWLYQNLDAVVAEAALARLQRLVDARLRGEPLAYLVGSREFYGRDFAVDSRALVPRPETEALLEVALRFARQPDRAPARRIVDVGTGSGILAISLALELPAASVVAVDLSADALAVARANACRYDVAGRVSFVQADLLETLTGPFDLVVANLPYVPSGEIDRLQPEVRREPRLALDGGPDGLDLYRRFFRRLPAVAGPATGVFVEIASDQGERVAALARAAQPAAEVAVLADLEGRDRVVAATPRR